MPVTAYTKLIQYFLLLTCSAICAPLCAQTIKIKLVDGRNGRPVAKSCVNVWVGRQHEDAMAIPTDKNGVAELRLTDKDADIDAHNRWKGCGDFGVISSVVKYDDSIGVHAGYALCQADAKTYSWLRAQDFPTKRLVQQGIVTTNVCGKVIDSPRPGQLVIFVRPLTFWEKLRQ